MEGLKPRESAALLALGYGFAVLLPIAGLIVGALLISRGSRHGAWIIGISIVSLVVYAVILYG